MRINLNSGGHRRVTIAVISLAALSVAALIVTSQLAVAHGARRAAPRLELTSRTPAVVRGSGFKPRTRVRLMLTAGTTLIRHPRANAQGSFTTTFSGVVIDRCTSFTASAVVNNHVVAVLRPAKPECAPASTP
jgi:hypothetical protein